MIVLSLILVIVAAVTLIAGIFQSESLLLIYVSIGACVGAMVLLGIGVLARRRTTTPATEGGYGPGATSTPVRPAAGAPTRPTGSATAATDRGATGRDEEAAATDDTVIVKKAAAPEAARKVTKKAVAKKTVARSAAKKQEAAAPEAAAEPAEKTPAKKSSKKPAAKKSSKKAAAKKSSKKAAAKKSAAKKSAAKKTTGADARAVLAEVPGVGPAKQDALLKAFGSLEEVKAASEDEVTAVPGIGPAAAKKIQKHLK